ncbi:hypothetical protein MHYP_G00104690 [Metynnis hypsauchen]
MKILLVFTLSLISGPVSCFDVIGYSGGSVLIYCKHEEYGWRPKYFCKKTANQCVSFDHNNKVSLYSSRGAITMIYRNLSLQDAGSYKCGEAGRWNHTVNLRVNKDPCCLEPNTVAGYLGETVTINCSYPEEFWTKYKFLCKYDGQNFIEVIQTSETQRGRFSISDDRSSSVFSVRISDVRDDDGGVYYCGVWSRGGDSVSYYSLYSETQLQVTASMAPTSVPPDEDPFSSSVIIISVCVCVVLLLIGGSALIFYKLRHKKNQDTDYSPGTQMEDIKEVPPEDSHSEETEHTGHVSAFGIYANASSATNSSDPQIHSDVPPLKDQDPTYTTVSFQKNPASPPNSSVVFSQEESATEYATIRHHTRQEQL